MMSCFVRKGSVHIVHISIVEVSLSIIGFKYVNWITKLVFKFTPLKRADDFLWFQFKYEFNHRINVLEYFYYITLSLKYV